MQSIDLSRVPTAAEVPSLEDCEVREVDPVDAAIIHSSFHYIASVREGMHYGLYRRGGAVSAFPLTLLTFSSFDLPSVQEAYGTIIGPSNASVLSRVYSFPGSPRNAFTYTFRRAFALHAADRPGLTLTLTYVNPNVGFSGTSYFAGNWARLMREHTKYDYLDNVYITRRELTRMFGVKEDHALHAALGERLTRSQVPLSPLLVLALARENKMKSSLHNLNHSPAGDA